MVIMMSILGLRRPAAIVRKTDAELLNELKRGGHVKSSNQGHVASLDPLQYNNKWVQTYLRMSQQSFRITASESFNGSIIGIIFLAGILVDIPSMADNKVLEVLDIMILFIFLMECGLENNCPRVEAEALFHRLRMALELV